MTRTLRLTTFSRPSALLAAQHRGYLEDAGLALEVDDATGSRPQMEGLLTGRWDLAHTNPDNVMKFRVAGNTDLFIFLVLNRGTAQKLVVQPHIKDWENLRGGRVGVDAPDSGYAFVLYDLLQRHGIAPGSYKVVALGATVYRLRGLERNEIDAGLLSHQHEATALEEGFPVLADTREHFAAHAGVTAAATHSWAERNQEALHGYTQALLAAATWAYDPNNHEDVVQVVAEARGIDEDQARRMVDIEKAGRTSTVLSIEDVEDSLTPIATLRARFTGEQPTGYFDGRAMSKALAVLDCMH